MYAYPEGIIKVKHPTSVVLDVGGVGYEVITSLSTSASLPAVDQSAKVLTDFIVREDSQQLFGFATEEERELFRSLRSVSGIGPKLAITILSGLPVNDLIRAVGTQDMAALNAISGVGKKTAERIILEMKGKVGESVVGISSGSGEGRFEDEKLSDALQALISLGYKKASAETALQKALKHKSSSTVEDLVRESLKKI